MSTPTAPTVIFLHLPKTAGSTLRALLRREYGPEGFWEPNPARGPVENAYHAYLRGEGPPPKPRGPGQGNRRWVAQLESLPAERVRSLRLCMGHFWFGLHEHLPGTATYMTMLRDPVARVLSMYAHRRANHGYSGSLEDYLSEGRDWEIDNGQVRRLASEGLGMDITRAPVGDRALASAAANLRAHVPLVGVTDRFDEFLAMGAEIFGWRRLGYSSRNISSNRPKEDSLPRDVVDRIRRVNEADLELYRMANELIDERMAGRRASVAIRVRRLRARNAWSRRVRPTLSRVRRRVLPRSHTR